MFRLYYQATLTGTWMPMPKLFSSEREGKGFIANIKLGNTDYRTDLEYKVEIEL